MKKIIITILFIFLSLPLVTQVAAEFDMPMTPPSSNQCTTDNQCSSDSFCSPQTASSPSMCLPKRGTGTTCARNEECTSSSCNEKTKFCFDPTTGEGAIKFEAIAPTLQINIPTLQPFTTNGIKTPDLTSGYLYVPFLGQYLVGIFRWTLLVAGIIAAVLIMVGGFVYMTAGGNKQRVDAGKERILHAVFGLLLLLASYTILYIINPGLVEFRSLKIKVIERKELKEVEVPPTPEDLATVSPISGYNNVKDFKQFDKTWGSIKYGTGAACTVAKGSACGPASLADVLNFYNINVTPLQTMEYAIKVGARLCDDKNSNGTDGKTLVEKLSSSAWADKVKGEAIINKKDDTTLERIIQILTDKTQPRPVMFGCDDCLIFDEGRTIKDPNPTVNCRGKEKGKNKCDNPRFYDAHFMVLTGYDSTKKIFYLNDPGFGNIGKTYTSYDEVKKTTSRFYYVSPK